MKNIVKTGVMVALWVGASAPVAQAQSPRLDPTFALTSTVTNLGSGFGVISDMALQPDGKLVVAGSFREINGRPAPGLARLLADGQVDTTFAAPPTSAAPPTFNIIRSIALQADGKLLIGGDFTAVGGQPRIGIARLLPDGSLDPGFLSPFGSTPAFSSSVDKVVVQPGRGILALGFTLRAGSSTGAAFAVRRLDATGVLDPTFQPGFSCNDVLVLPTGSLVFAGLPRSLNGQPCTVWATGPDGVPDPAFVPLPGINTYSAAHALARDPATGELYVVRETDGTGTLDFEPLRLRPNGVPDPTFRLAAAFPQSFGGASSVAVQPNGRLLMGGGFTVAGGGFYGSVRLLRSGALDVPATTPGSARERTC